MGNNSAAARCRGSAKDGKVIALSHLHEKKPPTPDNILIDVVIHNGNVEMKLYYNPHSLSPKVENGLFWSAYRQNGSAWDKMEYCGALPDNEIEGMAKPIKPLGSVTGEGIKLHECFKFTAGHKYKIVAEFAPLPNRDDGFEAVEIQL